MKRILLLLIILAGGAYYVNQAGLVPGWAPLPLPEWVPDWARIAPHAVIANGTPGGGGGRRNGQGGGQGRGGQGGDGPVPVVAAAARYEDVPVTADAVGTVQALNTVQVSAQVDGKILEIDFTDGQDVKKGDVLARIDPATYQAQYDQAVATKAKDEATLANARNDLIRYQKLAMTEAGSKQQADTQKALVAQLEAQVAGDQAQIDNTKATLAYTTIVAPIDGRTGIRQVDQGNIVRSAASNSIVVITQVKPINVVFNLPQQQLRAVNAAMAKGPVAVNVLEADNATVIDKGTVQVIDNQVDQTTGTIKLKSIFPNDHLQLWPGQFVNVRLYVDMLQHAVVVPTAAVQRGPNGAYVYVLGDNHKVGLRNVKVGRQNETEAVVTSGLTPPEQVITTGFARLTDGSEVRLAPAEASADAPAPAEPQGGGQRKAAAGQDGAPAPAATATDPPARATGGGAQAAPLGSGPPRSGEGGQGRRRRDAQQQGQGPAAGTPQAAASPGTPAPQAAPAPAQGSAPPQ